MSDPAPRPAGPKMFFKESHKAWFVRIRGTEVRLAADEEAARRRYREVMADPRAAVSAVLWGPRWPPAPPTPAPKPRPTSPTRVPLAPAPKPRADAPTKPLPKPGKMRVPLGPQLVHHRDVAAAFGVPIPTLLRWVRTGEFAAEHSSLGSFYFFDLAIVEYRLERGLWPDGTKFHGRGK